jgi:SAM-dependent methyltransferase
MPERNSRAKNELEHSISNKRSILPISIEKFRKDNFVSIAYQNVRNMLRNMPTYQRSIVNMVLNNRLAKFSSEQWQEFFRGEKVEFPYYEMEGLVSAFYEELIDTYIGVDSLLPSEFISKIHPYLLRSLISTIHENVYFPPSSKYCHGRHIVRILRRSIKDLDEDYNKNENEFKEYLKYHEENGYERIILLWVDPDYAERIAHEKYHLWTTDVGLWIRNCALLFQPTMSRENKIALQLINRNPEKNPSEKHIFDNCVSYVKDIINHSRRLTCNDYVETTPLDQSIQQELIWSLEQLIEPKLAKVWHKFVNPPERMKVEGVFLENKVLKQFKNPKIFDAASGVGAETIWLKKKGYDVTPNEIVWEFIEDAYKLAAQQLQKGKHYETWAYDWRHLEEEVHANLFDVVLVLGNSLTCLMKTEEMRKCLAGFHHILKPKGILVIDTRNYKYMFDNRDLVLSRNFRFRQEVVYPSKEIKAKPSARKFPERLGRPMVLEYYDNGKRMGQWEVYAYEEHEMEQLLEQDGLFSIEERYWDFKETQNPSKPAEFITFIARVKK